MRVQWTTERGEDRVVTRPVGGGRRQRAELKRGNTAPLYFRVCLYAQQYLIDHKVLSGKYRFAVLFRVYMFSFLKGT